MTENNGPKTEPCPHEALQPTWAIDQEHMTVYGFGFTCTSCDSHTSALDDEIVLGPWEPA